MTCFRLSAQLSVLLLFIVHFSLLDAAPATNSELMNKLERASRIKGLLRQLDSLPDNDLKELLIQLRALRRSRVKTPPVRDVANVPLAQLTDEELMQISDMIPMVEKRKRRPPVRLDIPHDLIRVPVSKFIEAFRIVNGKRFPKDFDVKILATKDMENAFGGEERQGNVDSLKEDINAIENEQSKIHKKTAKKNKMKEDLIVKKKRNSELRKAAQELQVSSKEIDLDDDR